MGHLGKHITIRLLKCIAFTLCLYTFFFVYAIAFMFPGPEVENVWVRVGHTVVGLSIALVVCAGSGLLFREKNNGGYTLQSYLTSLPMIMFSIFTAAITICFVLVWGFRMPH